MNEKTAKAYEKVASYAVTAKTTNTREWMEGLQSRIQAVCDAEGIGQVCTFDGTELRLRQCESQGHKSGDSAKP